MLKIFVFSQHLAFYFMQYHGQNFRNLMQDCLREDFQNQDSNIFYIFYDPDGILTNSFFPSFSTSVNTGICFFLSACTTGYPANI